MTVKKPTQKTQPTPISAQFIIYHNRHIKTASTAKKEEKRGKKGKKKGKKGKKGKKEENFPPRRPRPNPGRKKNVKL